MKKTKQKIDWNIKPQSIELTKDYLNDLLDKDFSSTKNLYDSGQKYQGSQEEPYAELIPKNNKNNTYESFVYAVSLNNPDAWGILAESLHNGYGVTSKDDYLTKLAVAIGLKVNAEKCKTLEKTYNLDEVNNAADTLYQKVETYAEINKGKVAQGAAIACTKLFDKEVKSLHDGKGFYDILPTDIESTMANHGLSVEALGIIDDTSSGCECTII